MQDEDVHITITDVRRVYCVNGARKWARQHDLDFKDFIRNGIAASEVFGRGDDALVRRVIEAKKEAENGQR